MKTCSRCSISKPIEDYYTQSDRKNGASHCKECHNAYCVSRWIKIKHEAIRYKGGSCLTCGYSEHYAALQFHHREPENKDVVWNKLRLRSWDKIVKELDKCDLLCANCHSIVHSSIQLS
jgi:hypothetical protein